MRTKAVAMSMHDDGHAWTLSYTRQDREGTLIGRGEVFGFTPIEALSKMIERMQWAKGEEEIITAQSTIEQQFYDWLENIA